MNKYSASDVLNMLAVNLEKDEGQFVLAYVKERGWLCTIAWGNTSPSNYDKLVVGTSNIVSDAVQQALDQTDWEPE